MPAREWAINVNNPEKIDFQCSFLRTLEFPERFRPVNWHPACANCQPGNTLPGDWKLKLL
jgi:hypothetical protein